MFGRQDAGAGETAPQNPIDAATLAMLLDHAYDAIMVRRISGEIIYWNRGAERIYGYAAAEAIGKALHTLLQTRFPRPLAAIDQALHENRAWEGRLVHTCRDGRLVTVDSRWALDAGGAEGTVLEIDRDISARLEAEDSARVRERELRFITDSAPVLIAHCDLSHRFRFVNRPYAARFGLHPSDLVGKTIPEVLGNHAYQAILPYLMEALSGRHVDVELSVPYEPPLGTQHMRFAYEPEFDDSGAVVGYVAAIINVSDRHRAEEALIDANKRKDEFLATLAHELRNPLAAMGNAVELMRLPQPDSARSEKAAAIIQRQLKQLVRLVDDLLDVSRITRGRLQLRITRIELADVIRTAVESTSLAIGSASQTLQVQLPEEPILLDGDAERLSQVFTNLLMNATKYTPAGGHIAVEAVSRADTVTVTVTDTGSGIPADMLEAVFEMFTQVHSTQDHAGGGMGIGLTLVRSMVALHGGTITAESAGTGRGSTFRVTLPRIQQAAPLAEETPAAPAEAIVIKRVLIADDNTDAAESLQLWLEMSGHEVHTASTGPAALQAAESLQPQVALLDLGMPGMSGLDVARRIRQAPWGANMILVALTGWGQDEDRRRTKEAGFDHHLTKPVPPDQIEELVRNA